MEEFEELKETYLKNVELNKAGHDAVLMGSLGISLKLVMYTESIRLIKEYEDRMKELKS